MTRLLKAPYDLWARWLMAGAMIVSLVSTGYFVGKVKGVHQERRKAWRDCAKRYEQTAKVRGWTLALMPCEEAR